MKEMQRLHGVTRAGVAKKGEERAKICRKKKERESGREQRCEASGRAKEKTVPRARAFRGEESAQRGKGARRVRTHRQREPLAAPKHDGKSCRERRGGFEEFGKRARGGRETRRGEQLRGGKRRRGWHRKFPLLQGAGGVAVRKRRRIGPGTAEGAKRRGREGGGRCEKAPQAARGRPPLRRPRPNEATVALGPIPIREAGRRASSSWRSRGRRIRRPCLRRSPFSTRPFSSWHPCPSSCPWPDGA